MDINEKALMILTDIAKLLNSATFTVGGKELRTAGLRVAEFGEIIKALQAGSAQIVEVEGDAHEAE